MASFGDKLRSLREGHGLSQAAVARAIQITPSAIWILEEHRQEKDVPSLETALRTAFFFGMRLEWLLRPDVGITQAPRPFSVGLAPLPLPERSFVPRYFGAKLRFLRMTHDETVRGLGAVIQRTSPYITRLEQGTRLPSFVVACALADHYQVSLDFLLWDDDLLDALMNRVRRGHDSAAPPEND